MSKILAAPQTAIAFAEECDRGRVREENQDVVRHASTPLGDLMIVADGLGGYEGGGVAAEIVVDGICAHLAGLPPYFPPVRAIREASEQANAGVLAAAGAPGSPYPDMGSTVVLALLRQSGTAAQAWIGHAGDSRAYLLRCGRLRCLTRDHSAVQELIDGGLITPEGARHHPDASVLTRSLGHRTGIKIDVQSVRLMAGDTLLLCSDGLWGFVSNQLIERVLAYPGLPVDAAARTLLELALDAGGRDNIGIELARLKS